MSMMTRTVLLGGSRFRPSALKNDLVSWWSLDEASGTRADSHGSNDLTDNNTVTSTTGVQGNAAVFVRANSEYLSVADNASLSTGDVDFTVGVWAYLANKTNRQGFAIKGASAGFGGYEWLVYYNSAPDRFLLSIQNGSDTALHHQATAFGSPTAGTWYYIFAWHDSVNNTVNIQVNNGEVTSAAYSAGCWDSTHAFQLGKDEGTNYLDGRIDEPAFWKRLLTLEERTWLYNGGLGRSYSEIDV